MTAPAIYHGPKVLSGHVKVWNVDCLNYMIKMPSNLVDLVFCSPPYENARTSDPTCLSDEAWVDWMTTVIMEAVRVCSGLVAVVCEGRTLDFSYSAVPFRLMASLHAEGVTLRKPPVFHKAGIPGSGGPDWFRNDYETILCATQGGRLPWSDPTATGKPPKYPPGGNMSHRTQSGSRVHPSEGAYKPPKLANPGNVFHIPVGGGHMGHPLAHKNEAPFPERLAEVFVRSFCPPGGLVYDPFGGSGTTCAVAAKLGRHWLYNDIREDQCRVAIARLNELRDGTIDPDYAYEVF